MKIDTSSPLFEVAFWVVLLAVLYLVLPSATFNMVAEALSPVALIP